ncbi:uncharacterized protein ACNLHF_026712 isoform 2-T2 [Anomaloglossus baeobatrachus]
MPEDTQDLIINGSKISVGPRGSVSVQRCITFRDSTRLDLVTGLLPRHISRWISTLSRSCLAIRSCRFPNADYLPSRQSVPSLIPVVTRLLAPSVPDSA